MFTSLSHRVRTAHPVYPTTLVFPTFPDFFWLSVVFPWSFLVFLVLANFAFGFA